MWETPDLLTSVSECHFILKLLQHVVLYEPGFVVRSINGLCSVSIWNYGACHPVGNTLWFRFANELLSLGEQHVCLWWSTMTNSHRALQRKRWRYLLQYPLGLEHPKNKLSATSAKHSYTNMAAVFWNRHSPMPDASIFYGEQGNTIFLITWLHLLQHVIFSYSRELQRKNKNKSTILGSKTVTSQNKSSVIVNDNKNLFG